MKIKYYHASLKPNLDKIGIDPMSNPTVSRDVQGYVYLGSMNYIKNQYLTYAPTGKYYIYEVDPSGMTLFSDLPGEQVRVKTFIEPSRVKLVDVIESKPDVHPREAEYLQWMKELGKE